MVEKGETVAPFVTSSYLPLGKGRGACRDGFCLWGDLPAPESPGPSPTAQGEPLAGFFVPRAHPLSRLMGTRPPEVEMGSLQVPGPSLRPWEQEICAPMAAEPQRGGGAGAGGRGKKEAIPRALQLAVPASGGSLLNGTLQNGQSRRACHMKQVCECVWKSVCNVQLYMIKMRSRFQYFPNCHLPMLIGIP